MNSKTFVHSTQMPVRWGDMDAFGHVNNTVYFRYIESARIEWMEQLQGLPRTATQGPVLVSANMNFIKQLTYPAQIEVSTFIGAPGRSSFTVSHEIRLLDADGKPGDLHAEGGAKVVWIDFTTGKSTPLPEELRAILEQSSSGDVA